MDPRGGTGRSSVGSSRALPGQGRIRADKHREKQRWRWLSVAQMSANRGDHRALFSVASRRQQAVKTVAKRGASGRGRELDWPNGGEGDGWRCWGAGEPCPRVNGWRRWSGRLGGVSVAANGGRRAGCRRRVGVSRAGLRSVSRHGQTGRTLTKGGEVCGRWWNGARTEWGSGGRWRGRRHGKSCQRSTSGDVVDGGGSLGLQNGWPRDGKAGGIRWCGRWHGWWLTPEKMEEEHSLGRPHGTVTGGRGGGAEGMAVGRWMDGSHRRRRRRAALARDS